VAAAGVHAGQAGAGRLAGIVAPVLALLFLLLTTALLVLDLKRPDRFHYILFKGNRTSWLVWGAWILMGFGLVSALWLLGGLTGHAGWLRALAVPALVLAVAAAGYSAFLFGQAEGRDFWQSPLLLPHLVTMAVVAGAAALLVLQALGGDATGVEILRAALVAGLLVHAGLLAIDLYAAHPTVDAARAARLLVRGRLGRRFWGGVVVAGIALPIAVAWAGTPGAAVAAVLALGGLWLYEDLWVRAGQTIPLS
jgi:formate-dependent nitrite reductase membrane component NrfD